MGSKEGFSIRKFSLIYFHEICASARYSPTAVPATRKSISLASRQSLVTEKTTLNLIPDKPESLRVVEDGCFQDGAVGNANQPAAIKVRTDPTARFHQSGPQQSDVDHVAARVADLNSISHRVQSRKTNGERAGNARYYVLQRYRNTRADNADCEAEAAQAIFEEYGEEKESREISRKDDELANPVARIALAKAPRQRFFEHLERGSE